jgi:hypothetical protein
MRGHVRYYLVTDLLEFTLARLMGSRSLRKFQAQERDSASKAQAILYS